MSLIDAAKKAVGGNTNSQQNSQPVPQPKAAENEKPTGADGSAGPEMNSSANANAPTTRPNPEVGKPKTVSFATPHSPAYRVKLGGVWHKGRGHVLVIPDEHVPELEKLIASGRADLAQNMLRMKSPEEAEAWFKKKLEETGGVRRHAQQGPTSSLQPNQTPTGALIKDPHAPIMIETEEVEGQSEANANKNSGNADHLKAAANQQTS